MSSKADTLTDKANAAFRQATAKVIERARQTRTPVIVWEQGEVVQRSCEELELATTKNRQALEQVAREARRQAM